jgi:hypothetical protein
MTASPGRAARLPGDLLWASILCGITAALAVPASRDAFSALTAAHPFAMGFLKFAVLASMGELAATRAVEGRWRRPAGMGAKAVVWGLVGMAIVLMLALFSDGVDGLARRGLIPFPAAPFPARLLSAFLASALMNLTFGIAFMGAHRICDSYIDLRASDRGARMGDAVARVDWTGFVRFVAGRTVPLFWIPAHTVTFMLRPEYRVVFAAYLSLALGLILTYSGMRKARA